MAEIHYLTPSELKRILLKIAELLDTHGVRRIADESSKGIHPTYAAATAYLLLIRPKVGREYEIRARVLSGATQREYHKISAPYHDDITLGWEVCLAAIRFYLPGTRAPRNSSAKVYRALAARM